MKDPHNLDPYICGACGRSFERENDRKNHQRRLKHDQMLSPKLRAVRLARRLEHERNRLAKLQRMTAP